MLAAGVNGDQLLESTLLVTGTVSLSILKPAVMHAPAAAARSSVQLDAVHQNSPAWLLLPAGVGCAGVG